MAKQHVLIRADLKARLDEYSAEMTSLGQPQPLTLCVDEGVETFLETTAVARLASARKNRRAKRR